MKAKPRGRGRRGVRGRDSKIGFWANPFVIAKSALVHLASFFASGAQINGKPLADQFVETHLRGVSGTPNRQRTAQ